MHFKVSVCLVLFCFGQSFGIIYQLNETDYKQIPPLYDLEDYESCIESPGSIYCVANLEIYTESQNNLFTFIQEYSQHTVKHYNHSKIDRGVCVTRTCEHFATNSGLDINRDLRSVLEGCVNETIYKKYDLMAKIYNMDCEKQTNVGQIHVDYVDYIFLAVLIMLVVLTLVGSYYDFYSNDSSTEQNHAKVKEILVCFSVFRNLKNLVSEDLGDSRMDLFKGLHCIRTIGICVVVYGHTVTLTASGFTSDPHNFEKAYESVLQRIAFSITNIVQIFFFITGLFLSYFMKIYSETHTVTWKAIPKIVFQRWWRLTPAAAMVVGFTATWMRHLSHGPLWGAYINSTANECRHFFWTHIFYFNNYLFDHKLCAPHTWYIATDMQLMIMGLIIYFVIQNRSKSFKILALISLLLIGMASPALHIWFQDLEAFAMQKPELYRMLTVETSVRILHTFGHNHLPCFTIGMASGYWIYYLQQNKVDYSNSKILNFLCWCVIPIYLIPIYCGSFFYNDGDRPSIAVRMAYAATNKAFIGIASTIWIIGTLYKHNGLSKAFMEWSGWVIASKLSYCVYLLHIMFVFLLLGVRTQLTPVSFLNTFFVSIGILVTTYALALPFYLIVEAPSNRLLKVITSGNIKKKLN